MGLFQLRQGCGCPTWGKAVKDDGGAFKGGGRLGKAGKAGGNDIYHNNSSGLVHDPVQDRTINLGTRDADPVRVVSSSIAGVALSLIHI